MKIIRGLHNIHQAKTPCVLSIGNFDGVHLGHQHLFATLKQQATAQGIPCGVITFEPHPHEYFAHDAAAPRLTRFQEKMQLFRTYEIDQVICLRFNQSLANMSATDFIDDLLVQKLQITYIIIGEDFRFGKQRQGDINWLKKSSQQYGFEVASAPTLQQHDERISSTRIRQALQTGNMALAETLLGHRYCITGHIVHGDKRGQQIGFPTANIRLAPYTLAVQGVFAVQVIGLEESPVLGVANIGQRPTVGGTKQQLEVHLFNFNRNIYGKKINVILLKQLRSEQRFESLEALTQQIHIDVAQAQQYLAQHPSC